MSHSRKPKSPDTLNESIKAGHEVTDVSLRGVVIMGIVLVVAIVIIAIGLGVFHEQIIAYGERHDPEPSPLAAEREPPPGPGFEETPGVQLQAYMAEQIARRDNFGWDNAGARIPVKKAKEIYLAQIGSQSPPADAANQQQGGQQPASPSATAPMNNAAPAGEATQQLPESALVPGSGDSSGNNAEENPPMSPSSELVPEAAAPEDPAQGTSEDQSPPANPSANAQEGPNSATGSPQAGQP